MSTQPQVETVSTGADKAKLAVAAVLLVAGIVVFYVLGQRDLWQRVIALLVLVAGAVGVFFTAETGRQLIGFGRDDDQLEHADEDGRRAEFDARFALQSAEIRRLFLLLEEAFKLSKAD